MNDDHTRIDVGGQSERYRGHGHVIYERPDGEDLVNERPWRGREAFDSLVGVEPEDIGAENERL